MHSTSTRANAISVMTLLILLAVLGAYTVSTGSKIVGLTTTVIAAAGTSLMIRDVCHRDQTAATAQNIVITGTYKLTCRDCHQFAIPFTGQLTLNQARTYTEIHFDHCSHDAGKNRQP